MLSLISFLTPTPPLNSAFGTLDKIFSGRKKAADASKG
jgi:hypothetical protein